jgi:hypothetical protein
MTIKNQAAALLRDMRAILSSEAHGRARPPLRQSVLTDLESRNWITKVGDTYKSTQQGRQAVLSPSTRSK